jgi:parallel beta-helix repeat protein
VQTTWPINGAIVINDTSSATISENHISGAYFGFHILNSTTATGTNNVVTGVSRGLRVFLANGVAITRSDFTNYTTALDTDATTGIASCNWWGSPSGPHGIAPWISPVAYSPWSASPIANQPSVSCGL